MTSKRDASTAFSTGNATTTTVKKRRCLTPPQLTSHSEKLWLDALPSDICSRIASYVSTGKQTPSALSLAEASPTQRAHIVSALSGRLELCCDARYVNAESEKRWAELFRPDIQSLTLNRYFSLDIAAPELPLTLFNSSTLLAAEIWNEPAFLRAVVNAPALRRLKVSFKHGSCTRLLYETLAKLDLSELEFYCAGWGSASCPFRKLQRADASGHAMGRCCPNVKTLIMHCDHECHPWPFVTKLPNLRSVQVSSKEALRVPKSAHAIFPYLRAMDSVKIRGGAFSFWLATQLGSAVTCLITTETLSSRQLVQLSRLPRLAEVGFGLDEWNNGLLLESLCPSLPHLRSLRLQWTCPKAWSPRKYEWNVARFSSVTSSTILRIVQSSSHLAKLDLLYVRIETAALKAILKHIGPRLEHLWISIVDQDEPPFDRLETILRSLSVYNPSIRSLVLEKERIDTTALITILRVKACKHSKAVSQQGRRLYAALRMLQRSAAMFDAGVVEKWLTWYFWEQRGEMT